MREDVKRSLDTVFEHAKVNEKRIQRKQPKRNWVPTIAFAGIVAIAALLLLLPIESDNTQLDSTASNEADIFELKGTYIGDASKVTTIVEYALPDGMYNGIQLETKQEPYGIIVPLKEDLQRTTQLYVAMYAFTLIQNAHFIQFDMPEGSERLEKEMLAMLYDVTFTDIKSEFALQKQINLMTGEIRTVPQLQLIGQDVAFLEQAIQTAKVVEQNFRGGKKHYYMTLNEKEYLFSVRDQEVRFVMNELPLDDVYIEPEAVYQMTDDMAERFIRYVDSDYTAISGEVTFVGGNMITVEQSDLAGNLGEEKLLHVLVDDAKAFKVGDVVQVWTNEVTSQYPPQALATKIKYYSTAQTIEESIEEQLRLAGIPLVRNTEDSNGVFGVALNGVEPIVYDVEDKQLYLFEFENEAARLKGLEAFEDHTKFTDVTSFKTYEKGEYLLFYVHNEEMDSKNIPYVKEIQAVFDK